MKLNRLPGCLCFLLLRQTPIFILMAFSSLMIAPSEPRTINATCQIFAEVETRECSCTINRGGNVSADDCEGNMKRVTLEFCAKNASGEICFQQCIFSDYVRNTIEKEDNDTEGCKVIPDPDPAVQDVHKLVVAVQAEASTHAGSVFKCRPYCHNGVDFEATAPVLFPCDPPCVNTECNMETQECSTEETQPPSACALTCEHLCVTVNGTEQCIDKEEEGMSTATKAAIITTSVAAPVGLMSFLGWLLYNYRQTEDLREALGLACCCMKKICLKSDNKDGEENDSGLEAADGAEDGQKSDNKDGEENDSGLEAADGAEDDQKSDNKDGEENDPGLEAAYGAEDDQKSDKKDGEENASVSEAADGSEDDQPEEDP